MYRDIPIYSSYWSWWSGILPTKTHKIVLPNVGIELTIFRLRQYRQLPILNHVCSAQHKDCHQKGSSSAWPRDHWRTDILPKINVLIATLSPKDCSKWLENWQPCLKYTGVNYNTCGNDELCPCSGDIHMCCVHFMLWNRETHKTREIFMPNAGIELTMFRLRQSPGASSPARIYVHIMEYFTYHWAKIHPFISKLMEIISFNESIR